MRWNPMSSWKNWWSVCKRQRRDKAGGYMAEAVTNALELSAGDREESKPEAIWQKP